MKKIGSRYTYRDSVPTMSILTITSNVVYGKKTTDVLDSFLPSVIMDVAFGRIVKVEADFPSARF